MQMKCKFCEFVTPPVFQDIEPGNLKSITAFLPMVNHMLSHKGFDLNSSTEECFEVIE